jgi:predicted outer membrane repeat protein
MKKLLRLKIPISSILFFALVILFTQTAHATIWQVTDVGDSGIGTFREQVSNSTDGDTIAFDQSTVGLPIVLASTIDINKDLIILGNGSQSTILDGAITVRIMTIAAGKNVTIESICFKNGLASSDNGGAIYNYGILTLNECLLEQNEADAFGGAIFCSSANLTMNKCSVKNNTAIGNSGGAIYSDALSDLTCNQCTFSGNHCNGYGGAISVMYSNFFNSTFANNSSGADGGAIYCYGTMVMNNCTVSSNSAGNDGGGIVNDGGTLLLQNSIIAYNFAPGSNPDGYSVGSNDTTTSNNIISNSNGFNIPVGNHNQLDVDPLLEALADNGGLTQTCALLCSSPAIDSADVNTSISFDQRGNNRGGSPDIGAFELTVNHQKLVLNTNDLGPGSLRDIINNSCNGDTIQFDSPLSGSQISLSAEINVNTKITILGLGRSQLFLTGNYANRVFKIGVTGELYVSDLSFINSYSNDIGGAIYNDNRCTLVNCNFTTNSALDDGGAIYSARFLSIDNCNFQSNSSASSGGAISAGDSLLINKSGFSENIAKDYGGAITTVGTSIFTNSTFTGNIDTLADGGAINCSLNTQLTNCTVTRNYSGRDGGGICNNLGTLLLVNTIVAENNSPVGPHDVINVGALDGNCRNNLIGDNTGMGMPSNNGNIINANPQLGPVNYYGGQTLIHSLHCNSPAINAGDDSSAPATDQRGMAHPVNGSDIGAFEFDFNAAHVVYTPFDNASSGTLRDAIAEACPNDTVLFSISVNNNPIQVNSEIVLDKNLSIFGNGVNASLIFSTTNRIFNVNAGDTVKLYSMSMTGNSGPNNGGAIYNSGVLYLDDVKIYNSQSDAFAGAIFNNAGRLFATNSTFEKNRAIGNSGGAIYNNGGILDISYSTLDSNQANGYGGAISGSQFSLYNCTVSGNHSGPGGGGIYVGVGASLTGCTFANNSTSGDGGGIQLDGGTISIISTIVANNTAPGAGPDFYALGNFAPNCHSNLIGNSADAGLDTSNNNLIDVDPYLGPLANYGGPTKTHMLFCGSPAINHTTFIAGDTIDQRGYARVGKIDVGAYEFNDVDYTVTVVGPILTAVQTGATYQWFNCDSNSIIAGAVLQSYTATTTGYYSVIITNNGCTDTSECEYIFINSIPTNNSTNEVKLFPNPVNSLLTLEFANQNEYKLLRIISLTGSLVKEIILTNEKSIAVNTNELSAGAYFIELQSDKEIMRKKFVKE